MCIVSVVMTFYLTYPIYRAMYIFIVILGYIGIYNFVTFDPGHKLWELGGSNVSHNQCFRHNKSQIVPW